jgi:CTP:molybdopterin cytidylyltransferase MocA
MASRAAVILAAGQGTRMKSPLPKVLHPVGGRAMLDHAIDAVQAAGCERVVVVVGAHAPEVGRAVAARLGPEATAVQDPPLGTAHAVLAAAEALAGVRGRRGGDQRRLPPAAARRICSRCSGAGRRAPTWRCWRSSRPTRPCTAA